jgi:hypothetical protein
MDEEIRFQHAHWSACVVVYRLYRRFDHGARQAWVGSTDYPDLLLVSETLHPPHDLTLCAPGTSLCSSSTRRTPFTSVGWRRNITSFD